MIKTEQDYRIEFSHVFETIIDLESHERQLMRWFNDPSSCRKSNILDALSDSMDMDRKIQTEIYQEFQPIADAMMYDGFHITRIYASIKAGFMIALNRRKEKRTKRHPNAEKPTSRSRKGILSASLGEIATYGKI